VADTSGAGYSGGSGIWDYVGPAIQAGAGIYGATSAAGSAAGGYNSAADIAQNAVNTSGRALGPYAAAGVPALSALESLYGLNGSPPDYSGFYDQPGYRFSLSQGDQAIQRAANATGGGFSSTTLAQLANYNQGLASTQYNNYVSQLYGLAGLGLGGANALGGQAIQGSNIVGQSRIGAGNASASGIAGATGAIIGAAGRLPWGQIGNAVSNWWNGSGSPSSTPDYTDVNYNGGGAYTDLSNSDISNLWSTDPNADTSGFQ
jgi:hypothetical protein